MELCAQFSENVNHRCHWVMDGFYELTYDGVGILTLDVETLEPEGLLTDPILDFYLRYLCNELIPSDQRHRIAIYTASYFHQTIMKEGREHNADSENIRICDKDFVLMPAYFKEHWFLIILCYPRNINCDSYGAKEFPRIVILDSSITFLKAHRTTILQKFRSFVQSRIAHESGKDCKDTPSDGNELPVDFVPVAQQTNDYDCGLFLLEFAEKFILDNFATTTPTTIDHTHDNKDDAIDCDKKRQQIRDLIKRLSAQYSQWALN